MIGFVRMDGPERSPATAAAFRPLFGIFSNRGNSTMQDIPNSFEGAVVKPGGGGLGPDETGLSLVCVERKSAPILYGEYDTVFADNENDFGFIVGRFGYGDRASAGSTSIYLRCRFNRAEIDYLKSILIPFFSDIEILRQWRPAFLRKGRPLLGVRFSENWILEA